MITVYPAKDYNSFIDVVKTDANLAEVGNTVWGAKTAPEKEVLLIQSALIIKSLCRVKPKTCDFAMAQSMLINYDLLNDGRYLTSVIKEQKYTEAKVGSLAVKYVVKQGQGADDGGLPPLVKNLLSKCLRNSNSGEFFKIC